MHLATPGASAIEIPIGATLPLILRIARQHPREAIEVSGIAKVVDAAFAKENRLIEKAAAMLAPLGVPEEEVRRLVIGRARG